MVSPDQPGNSPENPPEQPVSLPQDPEDVPFVEENDDSRNSSCPTCGHSFQEKASKYIQVDLPKANVANKFTLTTNIYRNSAVQTEPGPDWCSSPVMNTTQDWGIPYPPSFEYSDSDTSSEGSEDESITSVELDENDESFVLSEDDPYV